MDDLISRQAAIDAIKELCAHYTPTKSVIYPHMDFVIEELQNLPSAQPEIIACADCKHWICHDRRCGVWNHAVKPLDWCSYAERREG